MDTYTHTDMNICRPDSHDQPVHVVLLQSLVQSYLLACMPGEVHCGFIVYTKA